MKNSLIGSLSVAVLLPVIGCSAGMKNSVTPPVDTGSGTVKYLRDVAAERGLGVGAAVGALFRNDAEGTQFKSVLKREFNVMTAENDMKHERLQPARGVYSFGRADSLVAFAEANNMKMRGHTLVWHRQIAPWLANGTWTPAEARSLLVEHINTVVGHYKGRIAAWDVVNEAVNDDGTARGTFYSSNIGSDYIALAFRTAHDADPAAPLFYNDYNIEGINAKSDSVYALVSALLAAGVPVHGVGFQGHFVAGSLPGSQSMLQNLARFAALGLKLQFTEVDVRLSLPATSEKLQTQANDYRTVFDVCMKTPACQMVVMWGVTDKDSWVPNTFAGTGDALLFDNAYNPKPAYFTLRTLLSGQ